jgi:hypothetical protein
MKASRNYEWAFRPANRKWAIRYSYRVLRGKPQFADISVDSGEIPNPDFNPACIDEDDPASLPTINRPKQEVIDELVQFLTAIKMRVQTMSLEQTA